MRTTLTLDDTLVLNLKRKASEKNIPFKTVVNQALQLGLEVMEKPVPQKKKYHTPVRSMSPKTGYDLDTIGRIADELEDKARTHKG